MVCELLEGKWRYNKGEWSEAYAFVKLLGEGKVYAADDNLERLDNEYYPILKMLRDVIQRQYILDGNSRVVRVADSNGNIRFEKSIEDFLNISNVALGKIKASSGSSFEVLELENFLKGLEIPSFKASSSEKADFKMEILDLAIDKKGIYTFSVKSRLGANATILNASKATNFIYKANELAEGKIEELYETASTKSSGWLKKSIADIKDSLEFSGISSMEFASNLRLIDSSLPLMLSDVLLDYYSSSTSDIETLTENLIVRNPLNLDEQEKREFYRTKMIDFVKASTLGMMPTRTWEKDTITGGLLTVKENGEVLCHHIFYGANELGEYLYKNTKLETPSTSRHVFGNIYEENDSRYINLNLQVRMR